MNLPGITNAAGLDATDRDALSELVEVAQAVEPRNRLLDEYYEGEQATPGIGIDNIPDSVDPGVRSDWARKAVTSVSERVRMDGFTFAGDYEDEGFGRIELENDLSGAFNRTVASELTHGCMFATVQRVNDRAVVRMHSAETMAPTFTWSFCSSATCSAVWHSSISPKPVSTVARMKVVMGWSPI